MSERGKGLYRIIFSRFFDSIRPKNLIYRHKENFVHKDYLGNTYYETLADPSRGKLKPIRSFKSASKRFDDFDKPIPPEWEAWLRMRRKDPPTDQEIEFNLAIQERKRLANTSTITDRATDEFEKNPFSSFPMHKEYQITPGYSEHNNPGYGYKEDNKEPDNKENK